MDADCLIKLTKSKLKELVCNNFSVVMPKLVKEEIIDNAKEHPDAVIIKENLQKGWLKLDQGSSSFKRERMLFLLFFSRGNLMLSALMTRGL